MEFNVACCIKWTMYVLAVLTVILAIATVTMDFNDNKKAGEHAKIDNDNSDKSHTGRNIALMFVMLSCAGFVLLHYFWPRLIFIVRMFNCCLSNFGYSWSTSLYCIFYRC